MGTSFQEIEHKYVVEGGFDRKAFLLALKALNPLRVSEVQVEDTYFILDSQPRKVFRHRFDREIQQLTVKSLEDDPEVRTEINLNLIHTFNQTANINAFLNVFGIRWSQKLAKDVAVAYFNDCEIVHYRASCAGRLVECVEFEAVGVETLREALPILEKYELILGFDIRSRETKSLFELLLLVDAPEDVKTRFPSHKI